MREKALDFLTDKFEVRHHEKNQYQHHHYYDDYHFQVRVAGVLINCKARDLTLTGFVVLALKK